MGRRAKVVLSKHDAADERLLIDLFISTGRIKVTKCAPMRSDRSLSLQRRRGGGQLPGHLNPLTMGDRLDVSGSLT